jgi:D-alanine-D-alanine ligase
MKINKHIEIVCATETRYSSMSKRSRHAIADVLKAHYAQVGITMVSSLSDLEDLVARKPDLVFLTVKYIMSNPVSEIQEPDKIWISDFLDSHGVAYTGSGQTAHELEINKPLAKRQVKKAGLKTSNSYLALRGQPPTAEDISLNFPVFIKPADRGGGLGIDEHSIANNYAELMSKVQSITNEYGSESLIEEYLPGREFSVAILRHENSTEFSVMPIELIAEPDENGVCLLSGNVKSSNTEVVLGVTDVDIKSDIMILAMNAFNSLGARDYGRIDIRLDDEGTAHFLEANLIPSLISGYGSFPKACVINKQLNYEDMVLHIVRLGFERSNPAAMENSRLATADLV